MNIYDELESLGFFEWLKEKGFGSGFTPIILDSIERSGYNAIAFRWFREKYNLFGEVESHYTDEWFYFSTIKGIERNHPIEGDFETYEEAELECLKKLIEIIKNTNK